MTDKQFSDLFSAALSTPDRAAFVLAHVEDGAGELWDVAHMSVRDIRRHTGLSQAAFSQHFCIPCRSVEDWEGQRRSCPGYLRLALAQLAGAYTRPDSAAPAR